MSKLNYMIMLTAVLAVGLAGCSKDSEPGPAQSIAKNYANTELTVTNAGEAIAGGMVNIEAIDDMTAKLTLTGIVNGQPSFQIDANVTPAQAGYTFTGSREIPGMKVKVNGSVAEGKAAVDIAIEMTSDKLVGSWEFSKDFDALVFAIANKSGKLIYYGNEEPTEMETADFCEGIIGMGSGMLAGGALSEDFAFTFGKDGYVGIKGTSNFSPEDQQDVNIPKLARYYYNPDTKVLSFDIPLAGMTGLMSRSDATPSGSIPLPLQCTLDENGKLTAVINPAFLGLFIPVIPTGEALDELLAMLDPVMPPDLAGLLPWLKGNIKTIMVAITDKENFESLTIGATLTPVTAPEE